MKTAAIRALALSIALNPLLASTALAQPYGPPPGQGGYGPPPQDRDYGRPPGYQPGYAYGDANEAPPEGYGPGDRSYDSSAAARDEDQRYSQSVQRWAAENCIDQRRNNEAAGAVIGGVLGALIGSGIAGRGNHTAGAVFGGAAGAMAGASIGANSTSPGCPPGYVVRPGAPVYAAPVFAGGYGYAAPPGYRPWVWYGGRWVYRPYPYHRYWYRYERRRHWRD